MNDDDVCALVIAVLCSSQITARLNRHWLSKVIRLSPIVSSFVQQGKKQTNSSLNRNCCLSVLKVSNPPSTSLHPPQALHTHLFFIWLMKVKECRAAPDGWDGALWTQGLTSVLPSTPLNPPPSQFLAKCFRIRTKSQATNGPNSVYLWSGAAANNGLFQRPSENWSAGFPAREENVNGGLAGLMTPTCRWC